ncbi:glycoside hydrolase domain-containing protein [Pedobacter sp. JCM 36344]|uniref:glycoside hydrolase domain-containing protein n=1 Tax=Pedobacter sp. JCM 36344 TaxID=3374280 RepID=UPI00397BBCAF
MVEFNIALSSISISAAKSSINKNNFNSLQQQTSADWNSLLSRIAIEGNIQDTRLFYSLLYRTMQSPYMISESDGQYRSRKGELQKELSY